MADPSHEGDSDQATQEAFFRMMFGRLDANKDGSITEDEMGSMLRQIGAEGVTSAQIRDLIHDADSDRNGSIEYHEFGGLLRRIFSDTLRTYSEMLQMDIAKEDCMGELKKKLSETRKRISNPDKVIEHVAILVVVAEEIKPVFETFSVKEDEDLTREMLSLAKVYTGSVDGKYRLSILQVAQSAEYGRHYSGYTQAAAISSLASKVLNPDILVSFGTAGGWPSRVEVGDVVIASGCVFLDRSRTSSKNSFDWGVFGGPTLPCARLIKDLGLQEGLVGAQINYTVTKVHTHLIDVLGIYSIDMESASEAQVCMQTGTNFMALKVISNGIFPGDGARMEEDYVKHKEMVSKKASSILSDLLHYFAGKTVRELETGPE